MDYMIVLFIFAWCIAGQYFKLMFLEKFFAQKILNTYIVIWHHKVWFNKIPKRAEIFIEKSRGNKWRLYTKGKKTIIFAKCK